MNPLCLVLAKLTDPTRSDSVDPAISELAINQWVRRLDHYNNGEG